MSQMDHDARRLAQYITDTGLEPRPLAPEFYYASLPLCVADAVFSIGVRYSSTRAAVLRFCERQGWASAVSTEQERRRGEHRISEFLELCEGQSPEAMADNMFGNRQRTSSRSGILKAEAVKRFAEALLDARVDDFCDLTDGRLESAEALVREIPGQKSGISFDYFRMLAGDDDLIKPDRMVQRYIANALGETPQAISPERARVVVQTAAKMLGQDGRDWSPRRLDYTIWALQSGAVYDAA